jgi:hypothetical protein
MKEGAKKIYFIPVSFTSAIRSAETPRSELKTCYSVRPKSQIIYILIPKSIYNFALELPFRTKTVAVFKERNISLGDISSKCGMFESLMKNLSFSTE